MEVFFEETAPYWEEVYGRDDVWGAIYRRRRLTALSWIDGLELPPGARALEIGCGTGLTALALAERGFQVEATDAAGAMLERTRARAAEAGLGGRLRVRRARAEALDFEDAAFDLVVALGVLPWVDSPKQVVREMARVLRPGGYALLSADNRRRLTHLLDPACNPALSPVVKPVGRLLVRLGLRRDPGASARAEMHARATVDGWLAAAGLLQLEALTLGFGPFTLLGLPLLPRSASVRLDEWLDGLARRGFPGLEAAGAQHLVLAAKGA
jgi:SAM-dependent methyltransferase